MSWKPLDPYSGPPEPDDELRGLDLLREVAYFKRCADHDGLPYDPEWDRWIAEDPAASLALAKLRGS